MKDFPIDFFRDEVRNGFFIPTTVKQAWAAQLIVLDVIDKICTKHNITYFADWGTLLGTVRHGGYVPWDDDIDICMKREDYTRFKQVAMTELPEHFCIHDYEQKENHWLFLSRVVNNIHICYEPEHMNQFYNFPYLTGIDIFVLDYLYQNPEEEKERCEEVKRIIAVADMIIAAKISDAAKEMELSKLEHKYHTKLNRSLDHNRMGIELYRLAEQQMARVPKEQSGRLGQIFPWVLLGNEGLDKKYYDRLVRLPFENTTMPVPADYHKVLGRRYRDYFTIHKVWNGHKYPFFEKQRENLQAIADFKLPEFTFDVHMLRQNSVLNGSRNTMQKTVMDALADLETLHQSFDTLIVKGTIKPALTVLEQSQGMAIDLGNYIEKMKGKNDAAVSKSVEVLETYCERLFQMYQYLLQFIENHEDKEGCEIYRNENDKLLYEQFEKSFQSVKDIVENTIVKRKMVAFLPDNPQRWKEMESLYHYYQNQPDTEVYVIPLPVFSKNLYGEITATEKELNLNARESEYPKEINILSWDKIRLQAYEFEAVVIQNQYDGENPYLTVPVMYYAKELQKCTKCLIYLMPEGVNDFGEDDQTDLYGLKYSLAMPGAMYADKILIHSGNMKSLFVGYLTAFAGNGTEKIWQDKIMTLCDFMGIDEADMASERNSRTSKAHKTILYCIGENEFAEDAELALESMTKRLEIMTQYGNELKVAVCMYPYSISEWSICSEKEKDTMMDVLLTYKKNRQIEIWDGNTIDLHVVDAYYGSPSPFVCRFAEMHKPAMLSYSGE